MFALDIETLNKRENSVVLSLAVLHFDETAKYTYQELLDRTCFIKFNLKEQVEKYKRTTDKETIEWWKKQCDLVKQKSLIPSKIDVTAEEGLIKAREYIKEHSKGEEIVWTRGSLDQFALDSLCDSVSFNYLFNYSVYRDFRTAIDLLKETSRRGYCVVPGFNRELVLKHDPVHDVAYDAMMLMYGI